MPGDLGRTRFLLLLHYSLWNVVFISWFHTAVHRPRLSSITRARARVGTLHSSSSHHHFRENSLTDALNKKRIWRPQKKKNRSEPDKVSLSLPCAWPENSKFILFPGGWRPPVDVPLFLKQKFDNLGNYSVYSLSGREHELERSIALLSQCRKYGATSWLRLAPRLGNSRK